MSMFGVVSEVRRDVAAARQRDPAARAVSTPEILLVWPGVQALLVALAVRGVGSCWIGSTIFAADLVRDELALPEEWEPLGAIAIGYPEDPQGPRDPVPTDGLLVRK